MIDRRLSIGRLHRERLSDLRAEIVHLIEYGRQLLIESVYQRVASRL